MSGAAFTPAERAALDCVEPPAPRADFAADIVAAALADRPAPARRRVQSLWRHHRRAIVVAGVLLATSAAAATTGVFEQIPKQLPALASALGIAPPPHPVTHHAGPRPKHHAAPTPEPQVAPTPAPTPDLRHDVIETIHEAQAEGRRPLADPAVRQAIARRLAAMTPAERADARRRFLQTHPRIAERLAADRAARERMLATHPHLAERLESEARGEVPPIMTQRIRRWRQRRWRLRRFEAVQPTPDSSEGNGTADR